MGSNPEFGEELRRRIADFKERIDLNDLATWLGMEKPKSSGNWRSPHRKDKNPSVGINKDGRHFKDYTTGDGGSCIDLVMYVNGGDQWDAVQTLHRYLGLELPKTGSIEKRERTREEFIADQCLRQPDLALPYLVEQRKISESVAKAAIKAKQVGFNTWTSDKRPSGEPGHGGPAAAFIVRHMATSQVAAVDMRFMDPEMNGGLKTQTQGAKEGVVWTPYEPRRVKSARTVYIVESPINALSIESCGLGYTTAVAVRGLNVEAIDWSWLAGKQAILCFDADPVNEQNKRPGPQTMWKLYDILTAQKIAAQMVDQESWEADGFNDVNDILQAGGADEVKSRIRKWEDCAIAGLQADYKPGPTRVYLPSYDFAAYWRFKSQPDYMDYVVEKQQREATDPDAPVEYDLKRIPLAGFRLAALSKITVQSWQATCSGAEDLSPTRLFAATAQVPREGPNLQRIVFRPTELHKPAKWMEFGPVFKPEYFQRLVSIFERTVDLGERKAANFVGVAWLDGKLVVSEGSDCFFEDATKQCQYADLRFHRGSRQDAVNCVRAYAETFRESAALLPLIWVVGAPALKTMLGFWPHLQMQAEKGAGKSSFLKSLGASTGFTMLSAQQAQTAYRVLCSVGHTSMPVGWEEVSTNDKKAISTAMNILQECYDFAPHTRGSDNLRLLNSAPVLLAGEDMAGAETLTGKLVRTSLKATKQGKPVPGNLAPFPMRNWLDWIVQQDPAEIRARYERMHEHCLKNSRSSPTDAGAKRMTKNYAALMLSWALLLDYAGLEDGEFNLRRDLLAEMNRHIAETVSDREPFIWILEKLSNELARGKFEFPHKWDLVQDKTTGETEMCLLVRPTHVMDHFSSSINHRDWFNSLPVKTPRVFKQQCIAGGVVADDDVNPDMGRGRVFHCLALSVKAMEAKGVSMPVPDKAAPKPAPAPEEPQSAAEAASRAYTAWETRHGASGP